LDVCIVSLDVGMGQKTIMKNPTTQRGENILGWYHLKITSRYGKGNKNNQIIFSKHFIFKKITTIKTKSHLSIACTNIWLEVYFETIFFGNC
jgi:hypothetical protein